jgi:hypothetical protein
METLWNDVHVFLQARRAYSAQYLSERLIIRSNVGQKNKESILCSTARCSA